MKKPTKKPTKKPKYAPREHGYQAFVHFRVPNDFMPAVHAFARKRGLPSASWMRMVLIEALNTNKDPDT